MDLGGAVHGHLIKCNAALPAVAAPLYLRGARDGARKLLGDVHALHRCAAAAAASMVPPPKGLIRLAQIKVQAYHPFITDGCMDILRSPPWGSRRAAACAAGLRRLFTFLKGPFVDKKAMRHHHHSTHKRLIELYGESTLGQDATTTVHFLRYLEHDIMQVHPGISVRITLFSDELAEARASSAVASDVASGVSL